LRLSWAVTTCKFVLQQTPLVINLDYLAPLYKSQFTNHFPGSVARCLAARAALNLFWLVVNH
jgi:hypothetical protein